MTQKTMPGAIGLVSETDGTSHDGEPLSATGGMSRDGEPPSATHRRGMREDVDCRRIGFHLRADGLISCMAGP